MIITLNDENTICIGMFIRLKESTTQQDLINMGIVGFIDTMKTKKFKVVGITFKSIFTPTYWFHYNMVEQCKGDD